MRKKTADDEKSEEFKRLEKMIDGFNEAIQFLRDKGRPVEFGFQDDGNLWVKVDGVLLD